MEILAITILIIAFLYTIVVTPVVFNKTSFEKFEKWKTENNKSMPYEEIGVCLDVSIAKTVKSIVSIIVAVIMYLLLMTFLLWVGREIVVNWFTVVISSLEAIAASWNFTDSISKIQNEDAPQINRKRMIFSAIIDWIYCPMAIYLLLK